MPIGEVANGRCLAEADLRFSDACRLVVKGGVEDDIQHMHPSSLVARKYESSELSTLEYRESPRDVPVSGRSGNEAVVSSSDPVHGMGVPRAVIQAAQELALVSKIPVVAEVAGLVVVLINLATDRSELIGAADNMAKRCRTVLFLLHRATSVLKKVGGAVSGVG